MKIINVSNINLQFDEFSQALSTEKQTELIVAKVNFIMSQFIFTSQPQILLDKTSKITVIDLKESEE